MELAFESLSLEEKGALAELKQVLNEMLGDRLAKYALFGSKARGDFSADSDLDVAIIVRDLTGSQKRQILQKVAEIELEHLLPMSTLVLSENYYEHLKNRERRLALDIEREGISL